MPEIKNITGLNIEKELNFCVKARNSEIFEKIYDDSETIEKVYDISNFLLTDDDCIFVYDLADHVSVKHVSCYLRQYWREYWMNPDKYTFLAPFVIKDLLSIGFIKYAERMPEADCKRLYDRIFCSTNYCNWSDCPYAE